MSDPAPTQLFLRIAGIVVKINEGGQLDRTYTDAGNWTGGEPGIGKLVGSRWGISAASYPHVDIASLTWNDALAIYARDFWAPIDGDQLGAELGTVVFDAAINHGPHRAIGWLQSAVGVADDDDIGPITRAAIAACDRRETAVSVMGARILFMTKTQAWHFESDGLSRRLARVPFEAADAAAS